MSSDIVRRAQAGKLDPVYLIHSDQPLLVERAVRAIVDAAVTPEMRGFNHDVIETKGATATRIIAAAQTLPMMAARRAVLVRDLASLPASEQVKLLPYLDAPNPSTVLVILASKLEKRLKFYKQLTKKHKKILHELKAPKDLVPWIRNEADAQGVVLDRGAAERLADVVGKDLARLSLAIGQLALYVSAEGDRPIAVDDIDDLIADTRERSVFELTDAISRGDRVSALAAVGSLCDQRQSAVGVVAMLARHIRTLGMCHVAKQRRISRDADIARIVGAPPWKVRRLVSESRHYPPIVVGQALTKLSQADRELKGQTHLVKILGRELGERIVLDRLVSDIMNLRQQQTSRGRSRR